MTSLEGRISRTLRLRHGLVMGMLAVSACVSFAVISVGLHAEEHQADLLRDVARQEAGAHRIAFFALAYANARTPAERERFGAAFGAAIGEFETRHRRLVHQQPAHAFERHKMARFRALMEMGEPVFHAEVERFLTAAKGLQLLEASEIDRSHDAVERLVRAGTTAVPQGYELISGILQDDQQAAIHTLEHVGIAALIMSLGLPVLSALLVLRPMRRSIGDTVSALEDANRRAQAEAVRANRAAAAKDAFLATMSHELRTPMHGVLATIDLLDSASLTREQSELVEVARGSGRRLMGLLNEILDLARIESGDFAIESLAYSPAEVIEEVALGHLPVARQKGLGFIVEIDPVLWNEARGDALRLGQIVGNLVGNAVKFTETGRVVLRALAIRREAGWSLRVIVRDTGPGIPGEQHEAIFQKFQQSENGHARRHEGSGLGLAIARRLTARMGGTLGLVSSLGKGAAFTLELPLLPGMGQLPGRAAMAVEPADDSETPARQILLLMAEDPDDRAAARQALAAIGPFGIRDDASPRPGTRGSEGRWLIPELAEPWSAVLCGTAPDCLGAARALIRAREAAGGVWRGPDHLLLLVTGHLDDGARRALETDLAAWLEAEVAALSWPTRRAALEAVLGSFALPPAGAAPAAGMPARAEEASAQAAGMPPGERTAFGSADPLGPMDRRPAGMAPGPEDQAEGTASVEVVGDHAAAARRTGGPAVATEPSGGIAARRGPTGSRSESGVAEDGSGVASDQAGPAVAGPIDASTGTRGHAGTHKGAPRGAPAGFTARRDICGSDGPADDAAGIAPPPDPADVLVAEDNATNRLLLERMLVSLGAAPRFATNGLEALEMIRARRPDLVLMDLRMPDLDGLMATRLLRQEETRMGLVPLPVIAVTANAFTEDRDAAMAAGMSGFLAKPFRQRDLQECLSVQGILLGGDAIAGAAPCKPDARSDRQGAVVDRASARPRAGEEPAPVPAPPPVSAAARPHRQAG